MTDFFASRGTEAAKILPESLCSFGQTGGHVNPETTEETMRMGKINFIAVAATIGLFSSVSAHAASGCSKMSELDRKTRYTSMYDAKTQQALADLRQSTINELVTNFEPIAQELIKASPKFAEYFNGSMGSLHRTQLVESLFSVCAAHIDYGTGDAVRIVISNLATQLGVQ